MSAIGISDIPSLVDLNPSFTSSPPLLPSVCFTNLSVFMCACWQLYKELSQCYQALVSSEAKLRESHQELGSRLAQKDQHILQLQAQLQQQEQEQQQQLQAQQTTTNSSTNRQTNFQVSTPLIGHPLLLVRVYLVRCNSRLRSAFLLCCSCWTLICTCVGFCNKLQ